MTGKQECLKIYVSCLGVSRFRRDAEILNLIATSLLAISLLGAIHLIHT
jgi:hypothetical protein